MEEGIMEHWEKVDAFKNQLKQSEGKPEYSFYDGPPFATGSPHYGHILAGTIKVRPCPPCSGTWVVSRLTCARSVRHRMSGLASPTKQAFTCRATSVGIVMGCLSNSRSRSCSGSR
jgi:hypothetical protein